ncbi:hypothetical protein ACVWYH_004555 [Bradyrhizobium sp. GM24.11]
MVSDTRKIVFADLHNGGSVEWGRVPLEICCSFIPVH